MLNRSSRRWVPAIALIAISGIIAYLSLRSPGPETTGAPRYEPKVDVLVRRPATAPPRSAPQQQSPAVPAAALAPIAARSLSHSPAVLARQFETARDLKSFLDALGRNPSDAEEKAYVAMALQACMRVATLGVDKEIEAFKARLPPNHEHNALRTAMFTGSMERCRGFEGHPIAIEEIKKLKDDAYAAGSTLVAAERLQQIQASQGREIAGQMLKRVVEGGDPIAILNSLSIVREGQLVQLSDLNPNSSSTIVSNAWMLLACDFGLDCGQTSGVVRAHCASLGQCGAENLEAVLQRGLPGTDEAAAVAAARVRLREAIVQGNWTAIGLR